MDQSGYNVLARPAFAADKDVHIIVRHLQQLSLQLQYPGMHADEFRSLQEQRRIIQDLDGTAECRAVLQASNASLEETVPLRPRFRQWADVDPNDLVCADTVAVVHSTRRPPGPTLRVAPQASRRLALE